MRRGVDFFTTFDYDVYFSTIKNGALKMYAEAIKAIVERRNIRWLIHFTHINNLLSILDRGIIPRQQLEQEIYGGG